ncbi:MAG: hypothetical protein K2H85_01090 [Allobaculum sp.]|nr:hypothetical protein [Allobaculum sp.]
MKGKIIIVYLTLLLSLLSATPIWAGDIIDYDPFGFGYDYNRKNYYKNISLTVHNPESAKGKVYLTPYFRSDSTYCRTINDPKIAKLEGNITNAGKDFKVSIYAMPAAIT